jgi:hypothetical protein
VLSEDREPARRRVPRTLLVILLIQAGLSLLLMVSNFAEDFCSLLDFWAFDKCGNCRSGGALHCRAHIVI